jgi:hypothetical protein
MRKSAIAVVDLHSFARGGHFALWHVWFGREFARRFDQVLLITPDPEGLETYLQSMHDSLESNITVHAAPGRLRKTFDLQLLRALPVADGARLHAFMMWAFDLPPARSDLPGYRLRVRRVIDRLAFRAPWFGAEIPWGALTGISSYMRGVAGPTAEMERRLVEFFVKSGSCKVFLQADGYVGKSLAKAQWVPDIENVDLPPDRTALARRIRDHAAGRFCIGAVGILAGYRCIDEILPLALAHPEIRFVLAGKVYEQTVRPDLLPILQERTPSNVLFVPGFIDGETELNAAIDTIDAIFVDGSRYPVQSGIVCRAIHFGKCIVTPDSNSWSSDLIREWGVGINYPSIQDDIEDRWRQWRNDGGPGRARKASLHLRNPDAVAKCFDSVSARLKMEEREL